MSLWEIRKAVKPWLNGETLLFGCSGGADSMALAAALLKEAGNAKVTPVVVDHGLQKDSAEIAAQTVSKLKAMGFAEVATARANVEVTDGLEASARRARYLIFKQFIDSYQPKYFMLAHTLNDQAESVLLGLARGSGARSLSGMAVENNIFVIGSPDIDVMNSSTMPSIEEAKKYYGINFEEFGILMFHPVTTEESTIAKSVSNIVDACIDSNLNYIVIFPNNDLGSNHILNAYEKFKDNPKFKIFPSLRFEYFLILLKYSKFIIGNSSAGIREAPHYGVPTINLGSRQNNRSLNDEIININYNKDIIWK
jgi:tRNA(Ile)-lysidine synthetase-like protein